MNCDSARAQLAEANAAKADICMELDRVMKMRDEAQRERDKYFHELTIVKADARGYNAAINLARRETLERERDQWREVAGRLVEDLTGLRDVLKGNGYNPGWGNAALADFDKLNTPKA